MSRAFLTIFNWTLQTTFYVFKICICVPKLKSTHSYLRYSWFRNSTILLAKSLSDLTKLKTFRLGFIFLQSISACKKSRWLTLLVLRYSWFNTLKTLLILSIFYQTQVKIYKLPFTFLESISACQESPWIISSCFRISWFKNSVI